MVYAKQIRNGVVTALVKYHYEPQFSDDSLMEVITEEEYNELYASFEAKRKEE